jgi:ABC-type glycerol-3-phosphate transport system permease component
MAGISLASLPALFVFFLLQRRVIDSFVASGLRG